MSRHRRQQRKRARRARSMETAVGLPHSRLLWLTLVGPIDSVDQEDWGPEFDAAMAAPWDESTEEDF